VVPSRARDRGYSNCKRDASPTPRNRRSGLRRRRPVVSWSSHTNLARRLRTVMRCDERSRTTRCRPGGSTSWSRSPHRDLAGRRFGRCGERQNRLKGRSPEPTPALASRRTGRVRRSTQGEHAPRGASALPRSVPWKPSPLSAPGCLAIDRRFATARPTSAPAGTSDPGSVFARGVAAVDAGFGWFPVYWLRFVWSRVVHGLLAPVRAGFCG